MMEVCYPAAVSFAFMILDVVLCRAMLCRVAVCVLHQLRLRRVVG